MATVLSDTFTDLGGTPLPLHAMNTGPGWQTVTGTFQVLSNKAQPLSGVNNDQVSTDAGASDYTLTIDVVPRHSGGSWESDPDIAVRWTDTSHLWLIQITSLGGAILLYENVGAGGVLRASNAFAFLSGTSYAITVVCSGSTITVSVNGVQQFSYGSATSNQTATKIALVTGTGGAPTTLCTWDNLLVVATANTKIEMGEIRKGPPRGPYARGFSVPSAAAVSPVPVPSGTLNQVYAPEIRKGPPRGPFARGFRVEQPASPTPPLTPPSILARTLPFIPRVPDLSDMRRLGHLTEAIHSIINSLIGQGILIQTGPASWRIAGAGTTFTLTYDGIVAALGYVPQEVMTVVDIINLLTYTPASAARLINTTPPLAGGGSLAADLTLSISGLTAIGLAVMTAASGKAARTAQGFGEYVRVVNSANIALATGTPQFVTFDTTINDSDGFHSIVTNTSRLTVPTGLGGLYVVTGIIRWSADAAGAGIRQVVLQRNRGLVIGVQTVKPASGAGNNTDQFITTPPVPIAAGSFVEIYALQSSGSSLNLESQGTLTFAPSLGMYRIADL